MKVRPTLEERIISHYLNYQEKRLELKIILVKLKIKKMKKRNPMGVVK